MKRGIAAICLLSLVVACADADRDLPRVYAEMRVPTERLASTEARQRGQARYLESCALCHGVRGNGQGVRRIGLSQPPRDFTDPAWRRSTTPRHTFYVIRAGIRNTPMPAWPALSDEETWDVTAYVLSLGEAR
jgi:mono/diheme cytochrome c family protein